MGLCSSVPRNANEDMKLKLSFGSKSEKLVIPPTSIKGQQQQQPQNGWSTARSTTTFTDHGSKEEAFFDSKAWLDSDCEDDFYSVNGDFTPSRGTTPVHHTFGTPSRNRIHGSMAETSPEK
nr:unknown [Glycine max]